MVSSGDALRFKSVSYSYGLEPLFDRLSLSMEAGKIHALIGGSGSGKTTLLKLAMGTLAPTEGEILRPKSNRDSLQETGYVAQEYGLFDWLTVESNIRLGLGAARRADDSNERIHQIAKRLGIQDALYKFPRELSGGMRQRCSVARALIGAPGLLCMDEPFSALDIINREKSKELLKEIQSDTKTTTLFVSHDIHDALEVSDYIHVVARSNEGCSLRAISVDEVDPTDPAAYFSSMF